MNATQQRVPPGPRGHFPLGNLLEFARDVLGYHERCGGPRICIGNSFAMMEAVLLLASIARRFK